MKKIILLIISLMLLSGCTKIDNQNIDTLIDQIVSSENKHQNTYKNGYKFYLPSNIKIKNSYGKNVVLTENNLNYYMFVDLISYYNKAEISYNTNEKALLSKQINNNEKKGYIEVNQKNDKYLIEIMYNYAKIELMVDENNIYTSIVNSLIILTSIDYTDDIIKNMLEDDILNYSEESFSLFETESDDSNFLKVVEEYDNYNEEEIPDYDLIKEN